MIENKKLQPKNCTCILNPHFRFTNSTSLKYSLPKAPSQIIKIKKEEMSEGKADRGFLKRKVGRRSMVQREEEGRMWHGSWWWHNKRIDIWKISVEAKLAALLGIKCAEAAALGVQNAQGESNDES
jgi:predicted lysophospholipase L1 biosynthesis ABC-type transport system permease subunit